MTRSRTSLTPKRIITRAVGIAGDVEDMLALQMLPRCAQCLPWTGYSMRPVVIRHVVNEILINGRRVVVELGSGNSTIFAALALAQCDEGGRIYSIDHDLRWSERTSDTLRREGLAQYATVVHAPLAGGWYDRAKIPMVSGIDLLVVDGPPADAPSTMTSRAAALDVLGKNLQPGAVILVDDVHRAGEERVLNRWQRDYGVRFSRRSGGCATASWAS